MGSSAPDRLVAVVVLSASGWLLACAGDDPCGLEARSRAIGGPGLLDCGVAHAGETAAVDRCAVSAFQARSTFRAIYEAEDGALTALVHAAGDEYLELRETDDGIERVDCTGARAVSEAERRYVECEGPAEPVTECR